MICLKRNKQKLYLCKKTVEDNITKYLPPIEIQTDYQPTNSVGEVIGIGNEYTQYLKIKDIISVGKQFSNGDRCYVYVTPPEEHDDLCQNADFIVNGEPLITLNQADVRLKRLTGGDEEII